MAQRWYVAVTEPRDELSCIAAMKFVGIEAFSPHERFARKDQWKRWQLVARPRMPGYVFCLLDPTEISLALDLRHVACLLPGKGKEPRPIRHDEENRLEGMWAEEGFNARVTLDELLPKRERRQQQRPAAAWAKYAAATPPQSLLGEKLKAEVERWLEADIPVTQVEAA